MSGEPVTDYILRWQNKSMHCDQELKQSQAILLCIKGMLPAIAYPMAGEAIPTFEQLTMKARGIELFFESNPNDLYRGSKPSLGQPHKGKKESRESHATYLAKVATTSKGEEGVVTQPKPRNRISMEERW